MKRNEIWWAELPEPIGRRPVLLVSRDEAYQVRQKVLVAAVTTTFRGTTTEIRLGPAEGLRKPSVVNVEDLFAIRKDCLLRRAGTLPRPKIAMVDDALKFALALS